MSGYTVEVIPTLGSASADASLDVLRCTTTERLDNNDAWSLEVRTPMPVPVRKRTALRLTGIDGRIREGRVRSVTTNSERNTIELVVASPLFDLKSGGKVYTVVNGRRVYTITAALTISDWWNTYIQPRLAEFGLSWVSTALGTVENTAVLPELTFTRATILQMVQAFASASNQELVFARDTGTGLHVLSFVTQRNAAAPVRAVSLGGLLMNENTVAADDALVTHFMGVGEVPSGGTDAATFEDHLFVISAISSPWVALADPAGGIEKPIPIDDLVNGLFLAVAMTGSTAPTFLPILDSRASDSSVQLASVAGLSVGQLVQFRADASGTPIDTIANPTGVTLYGREVEEYAVQGARGEANRIVNGRFQAAGLSGWAQSHPATTPPAYTEIPRNHLNRTVSPRANGARSAGTAASVAFPLKNIPAGDRIVAGDKMTFTGTALATNADAIIGTDGRLTFALAAPTTTAFADGAVLSLTRRLVRSSTVHTATPRYAPWMIVDASALDELYYLSRATGNLASLYGSAVMTANGEALTGPLEVRRFSATDTSKYVVRYTAPSYGTAWGAVAENPNGALQYTSVTATGPQSVRLGLPTSGGFSTGSFTGMVTIDLVYVYGIENTVKMPTWCINTAYTRYQLIGTVTAQTSTYVDVALVGLPAETDLTKYSGWSGGVNWDPVGLGYTSVSAVYYWGYTWAVGTPIQFNVVRAARDVQVDGALAVGVSSIPTKPLAGVSVRRNFANGDTLRLTNSEYSTVYNAVLAGEPSLSTSTPTAAYDPAVSNFDETALTTLQAVGTWLVTGTFTRTYTDPETEELVTETIYSLNVSITAKTGTTVTFDCGGWTCTSINAQTLSRTVGSGYQDVSVSSATAWANDGTCTLTLSTPIAANLKFYKGQWASVLNWTGSSAPTWNVVYLTADVSEGATTLTVYATDTLDSLYGTSGITALYRAPSGSTLTAAGETFYISEGATADASGLCSVKVTATNAATIPDNAQFTIVRPNLIAADDVQSGSAVRLQYAIGGTNIPVASTPGLQSTPFYVEVPPSGSRVVTARVRFVLGAGSWVLGRLPAVAICNALDGTVLGWARASDTTITVQNAYVVTVAAQATLTTSQPLVLRAYGGLAAVTAEDRWTLVLDAWAYVGSATDAPFVVGSHGNKIWYAVTKALQVYGREVKTIAVQLAQILSGNGGVPDVPVVGATVRFESSGEEVRTAQVVLAHHDAANTQITFDALRPTAARILGVQ